MEQKLHARGNGSTEIAIIAIDWSGTASDDRKPVYEANMRILDAHGKSRVGFDEWISCRSPSAITFLATQGVTGNPATVLEEFKVMYSQVVAEGLLPVAYPDLKEVLSFLSERVPVIVISSHPHELLVHEAEEYGVKEYIKSFEGSREDKAECIRKVCSQNNVELGTVVYLGDMVTDIQAAKRAGVIPVGVTTGYHRREWLAEEKPDAIVDSLTEFQQLVVYILRSEKAG